MRIDKYLSHMTQASRQEVKQWLKKGRVCVNGQITKSAKQHIDEIKDAISVDGHDILYQSEYYYVMHKPAGVITATQDNEHRTVMDLLDDSDKRMDLFPVGRLDKDTTGLLLITNNGTLAHELLAPKKHVDKVYEALIDGVVTQEEITKFANGMELDGVQLQPAQLEIVQQVDERHTFIRLTIHEGKFHQVKRMFQAVGMHVDRLHRTQMGPLKLDSQLQPGMYRPLAENEIKQLKKRGEANEF